ncbi:serine/threonine protein kinase [Nocardiopsis sp. Huas11]|uniref:serine/threonine-protein kinase n=1 Tax=Nocardiopsis sp. Huas11 TaxID=2183912 RepID=UPI000F2C78F4|nr:serine/threonine-protein kinase [Nocardiopsis sp. Huas11]RKS08357.1 serine/threonine protein kinase [Nocardiopsis sp. Huas11]
MSRDAPTQGRPPSQTPAHRLPPGLRPLEKGDPARVGPYRLVGRIGAGGMGAVYGALDDRGHCVAVKTVHARFARRPRYREAFAREAAMLGRARGVSTARLHAADVTAKVPWLAFDYVPGRDLRAHVRAFGPLSGDMLRTFAAGTAEGLAALHAAGIAHRDIKPGNVILAPEGPKIVDFGIATEIGADRATDRAASYGTPGWVAPERFEGATAAPAADVFAWGALVALAATGRDPYGTGAPEELRRRAEEGSFDVDGVPDSLRTLVERALSPDPAARPAAVDLMRALLPPPQEVGETGRVPAERTLAAMLRAYWRGVDDAGHDPARWAAALSLLSAAGVAGGLASGTGAATGTGTAAGSGAGAAGGTTAAAGAPMVSGSSAAGGALSALAGSKLAAAGVGLVLLAGVAVGGYAVYAQLRPDPREVLASAAQALEEGEGFTARVGLRYTTAHAEEVAGRTGASVEDVLADSEAEQEYVYSAADQAFLIRGEAMGDGTTAVAAHRGEMYVYAERDEEPVSPPNGGSAERIDVGDGVEAAALSPGLVTSALRSLADSGQVAEESGGGGDGRVYSGPTALGFLADGALVEERAEALVEFDGDGAPVRMEYTTDQWRVDVELVEVDAPVRVEDPQVSAMGDGFGWAVVHGPVCGTVTTTDRVWEVQASGWGVDCEYAMDVADLVHGEGLTDESAREGRVDVLMGYSDFYGSTWLVDDSVSCSIFRDARGGTPEGLTFHLAPCRPAALTGETGELDESLGLEETEFAEAEFEERTLIDFYVSH